MSNRILIAALVLLAVSAAGCGNAASGAGGELRGKVYKSTNVSGSRENLEPGTAITLRFTDDGRLLANAGCNQLQGEVSLDGGKLAVAELSETQMGCNAALHEQDRWLSEFLRGTPAWKLDGQQLTLTRGSDEIVLEAEAAASLAGGVWTIDGLVTGAAVSSVPGGAKATLEFKGNTVEYSGCNSGSAPFKPSADGKTLNFDQPFPMTGKACEENLMTVELAVVTTLKGQVTYKLDGRSLTLTNPKGEGLQLRK